MRLFYVEHVALVLVLDMEKTNVGLDGPGLQPFNVPESVAESEFSGLCDLVQIATLRLVGSDKWGNDCFALTSPSYISSSTFGESGTEAKLIPL